MPHIWIVPFVLDVAQYSTPAHWSATTAIAEISGWKLAQRKLVQRIRECKGPSEPFAKLEV